MSFDLAPYSVDKSTLFCKLAMVDLQMQPRSIGSVLMKTC